MPSFAATKIFQTFLISPQITHEYTSNGISWIETWYNFHPFTKAAPINHQNRSGPPLSFLRILILYRKPICSNKSTSPICTLYVISGWGTGTYNFFMRITSHLSHYTRISFDFLATATAVLLFHFTMTYLHCKYIQILSGGFLQAFRR